MLLELISQDYTFGDKVTIFFTFLVAMIVALTIHEFAHAMVATKCGDPTPKSFGRTTLNPMAHIEPFGFLSFLVLGFGWAKPVPINTFNFKKYKRDTFLVSIAGVLSNLAIAFVFMPLVLLVFTNITAFTNETIFKILVYITTYMVTINVILFVFNLLPIYPLDGFNAIASYLRYENKFVVFMKKYGTIILLGLLIVIDIILEVTNVSIFNYLCYYITWPLTQFWSWVFGYGGIGFNYLGLLLFGVM